MTGRPAPPDPPDLSSTLRASGTTGPTASSFAGGECIASTIQSGLGGVSLGTYSITRNGAALTITSRSSSSGSSCVYSGTAGSGSIALGWQSCDAGKVLGIQCQDGSRRDIVMLTNSVNETLANHTLMGTQTETYNVFGTLTLLSNVTATR